MTYEEQMERGEAMAAEALAVHAAVIAPADVDGRIRSLERAYGQGLRDGAEAVRAGLPTSAPEAEPSAA